MGSITFLCPKCRERINAPDDMQGETSHCPSCRAKFIIPKRKPPPPAKPKVRAVAKPQPDRKPEPAPPPPEPESRPRLRKREKDPTITYCMRCEKPLEDKAVICINCGTDQRSGQRVTKRKPRNVGGFFRSLFKGIAVLLFLVALAVGILYLLKKANYDVARLSRGAPWELAATMRSNLAPSGGDKFTLTIRSDRDPPYLYVFLKFKSPTTDEALCSFSVVNKDGATVGKRYGHRAGKEPFIIFEGNWGSLDGLALSGMGRRSDLAAAPKRN